MKSEDTIPDSTWMARCFNLARRGIGHVSPNPPVGAILVYQNRILSEGYHSFFGGPHAEVNAIQNVTAADRHLIPLSTLYVSLEPCCITGKTPPCTDLIIREGIKDVRISTWDPNPAVASTGLDLLREKDIKVTAGILETEGRELIRPFTTNIVMRRPHILLKWAQSRYGYAGIKGEQVWLSEPDTKVWSHSQRAAADAILVGARTVETDNPYLTVREFPGRSPHRVIYDPNGRLNDQYHVFVDDELTVFYFSKKINGAIDASHIKKYLLHDHADDFQQILKVLFENHIGILLVEGGPYLLKKIITQDLWDEAWVIQTQHILSQGITAPDVMGRLISKEWVGADRIVGIRRVG
ncbi:MAG: bifunctional diaminohydroxyphosphoribosylaminopyrimidine deaminase/5-amino-6-(5-phosphoribosylamino)uracil reductase RibD [Saprospiraceae bacterium]|nr:bifunctional diaminohydroxyphosphoribosylaminopyrimidine deaminase/5-amino-6-(5-phosphoribosylamino)uracil reductase RibD [Saprospiraceae bacterium]